MNNKIKAIFFDIDGTLTDFKTSQIPEDTLRVLDELHEKGVKLFIATGRHTNHMWMVISKDLPFDGYVTLNGQICIDHNEEMIFGNEIDPEDVAIGREIAAKKDFPMMMIEKDRNYLNYHDEGMAAMYARFHVPYPLISEHTPGVPIYQMSMYGTIESKQQYLDQLSHCRPVSWGLGFDIIPNTGGKMLGIEKTIEHYGITMDETMAFGDADNDMDMIEGCGIGVAMMKAPDYVKEVADFVTKDAGEGGIRYALEHYGVL